MQIVYRSGLWAETLKVVNALSLENITTKTDTRGSNGTYPVAVDMRETVAARRVIAQLRGSQEVR